MVDVLSTDVFATDGAVLVGVAYQALRRLTVAGKLRAAAYVLPLDEGVARLIMAMAVVDLDRQHKGHE